MDPSDPHVRRLENLARLLDSQFKLPGTGFRFGLDGLIGLIPGVGDAFTGALGAYLIAGAWRAGARKRTLLRMGFNMGLDLLVGAIPVAGDIFDFAFKSNKKNIALLLKEHNRGTLTKQPDTSL